MSRWLQSVNHMLESLDDQAAEHAVVGPPAGAVQRGLTNLLRRSGKDDEQDEEEDDDDYDSYYDEDEEDEEGDSYYDDDEAEEEGDEEQLEEQPETNTHVENDKERITASATLADSDATSKDEPEPPQGQNISHASSTELPSSTQNDNVATITTAPSQGEVILANELGFGDDASEESNLLDLSNDTAPGEPMPRTVRQAKRSTPEKLSNPLEQQQRRQQQQPASATPAQHKAGRTNTSTTSNPLQVASTPVSQDKQVPPQHAKRATTAASSAPLPKAPPSTSSASRSATRATGPSPVSGNSGPATAALKRAQAEMNRLQTQLSQATARADAAEAELRAQHDELEAAAAQLQAHATQRERDEREAWEDTQWELDQQAAKHAQALQAQKEDYQGQVRQLRQELQRVEAQRQQEGGDLSQELQAAVQREQDALHQVEELESNMATLQEENAAHVQRQEELSAQLAMLQSTVEGATQSEQKVEADMDALKEAHQRQLAQRQERETELEQNIAQLSAALALERQNVAAAQTNGKGHKSSVGDDTSNGPADHEIQLRQVSEELVTVKAQLDWSSQRGEALQTELQTLSQERLAEAEQTRQRQESFDAEVAQLREEIHRLQQSSSLPNGRDVTREAALTAVRGGEDAAAKLRASQEQIKDLSDQLVRQQDMVDASKSEVLALKGRLQAALQRAEAAEREAQRDPHNDLEHDGGAAGMTLRSTAGGGGSHAPSSSSWSTMGLNARRRKRGGRTMRSALGIRASASPFMMQVVHTIDAVDLWILETGLILKQEPLARLGLVFYALILHLWCFALVCFHTVEAEHGDLDSLTAHRTVLSPQALNQQHS